MDLWYERRHTERARTGHVLVMQESEHSKINNINIRQPNNNDVILLGWDESSLQACCNR